MAVMIGVDPHKRSHTAVAIDGDEVELAAIEVRASVRQVDGAAGVGGRVRGADVGGRGCRWGRLSARAAARRGGRTGVGCAGDVGGAGAGVGVGPIEQERRERRLLDRGRGAARTEASAWSRRRITRACCGCWRSATRSSAAPAPAPRAGLHALLVELVPGGITKEITVESRRGAPRERDPTDPVEATRHELALEHLEDLRRIDEQIRASQRRIADSGARRPARTVTEVFGFGPVGAAIALGYTRDVRRFANRDRFAAYNGTAPIEVSSGGRPRAPAVAAREPATEPRDPHGRDHPDPPPALTRPRATTTANSPKARRRRKRSAR